jgi:hypothetical protein
MTAQARRRIAETPMAPYADLLLSMKPKDMLIVVDALQEAMQETAEEEQKLTAAEIIREKFKNLKISQETKDLVRDLTLPREAMEDERIRYILGYK